MREFRCVSDVIPVKVRDHQVVEHAHIRMFQHRHDAIGVTRDARRIRLPQRVRLGFREIRCPPASIVPEGETNSVACPPSVSRK